MYISMPNEFFIPVVYVEKYILNENDEININMTRSNGEERESTGKKTTEVSNKEKEVVKEEAIAVKEENKKGEGNVVESTEPIYVPLKAEEMCKGNVKIFEEIDEEYLVKVEYDDLKLDNK